LSVPGTPTAPPPTDPLIEAIEGIAVLDGPGKAVGKIVRDTVRPGVVRDLICGTPLGHPLHPVLTDVVIGSWLSATLLDVLGSDDDGRATRCLLGVGIVSAVPTAVSGTVDWAHTEIAVPPVRRAGAVHALSNVTALSLYSGSLLARRRRNDGRGKALALGGAAVLVFSAFIGGHLSFARGVGVNETLFDEPIPEEWTDAGVGTEELVADQPKSTVVGETPVMLLRHGDGLHALHDRCSHRGCSLSGLGKVEGEIVTCGCHGSEFDLRDGTVQRGPATRYQPVYEARESDGRIQVRLASPS
jgi:nitrite reductase/ring-hydroxylating ferredoxin subunit